MVKAVFVPLARTTFYMPSAEDIFNKSLHLLNRIFPQIKAPEHLLTEVEDVARFLATVEEPDILIYQNTTFVGAEFMYELIRKFKCPIIIWSVREPTIDGTRLKLNSLTGAFSAANSIYGQDRIYDFIFGNPEEETVQTFFTNYQQTLALVNDLHNLSVGVVGNQPAGFGFGSVNETDLINALGVRITHIEVGKIIEQAKSFTDDDLTSSLEELNSRTINDNIPDEYIKKYARLRHAFQLFVEKYDIKALASRCWPDFFTDFGAPVCAVLSMLNDNKIAAACETDIGGAISMFIGSTLTHKATYLGDPVAIDEVQNSIIYWHCGAGASSLANSHCGATLGVHPNRKIGPVMNFGLKAGTVTVLRLGRDTQDYRLFMYKGQALDEPQKFWGTSVTVRPDNGKVVNKVKQFIEDGWEPHFVIAYGDISEQIRLLGKLLQIRVFAYN